MDVRNVNPKEVAEAVKEAGSAYINDIIKSVNDDMAELSPALLGDMIEHLKWCSTGYSDKIGYFKKRRHDKKYNEALKALRLQMSETFLFLGGNLPENKTELMPSIHCGALIGDFVIYCIREGVITTGVCEGICEISYGEVMDLDNEKKTYTVKVMEGKRKGETITIKWYHAILDQYGCYFFDFHTKTLSSWLQFCFLNRFADGGEKKLYDAMPRLVDEVAKVWQRRKRELESDFCGACESQEANKED